MLACHGNGMADDNKPEHCDVLAWEPELLEVKLSLPERALSYPEAMIYD